MKRLLTSLAYRFQFEAAAFSRQCCFPTLAAQGLGRQGFFCHYERIGAALYRDLRPELADLVEVATAIYCADRFAPRRHPDRRDDSPSLARRLAVRVGVRQPGRWRGPAKALLEELLWELCGDQWTLEFTSWQASNRAGAQRFLPNFPLSGPAKVMLFSGGLDSFAGAAAQLEDESQAHVLVSGYTHSRMCADQRAQVRTLLAGRPARGHHVAVRYGVRHKPPIRLESSQRSRGLLHVCLGALAALHLGAKEIHIYENGIGALNLPFDATQSGWEVSRALHPPVLRLMERLIEEVSGQDLRIRLPFLFQTKAQSLAHPAVRRLAGGIRRTFSCDRFPDRFEGHRQCGSCSSCVLRRLALETAGLADCEPVNEYAFDARGADVRPGPDAAFVLDKIDAQATQFAQALRLDNPWAALTRQWPELRAAEATLVATGELPVEVRSRLLNLCGQHACEWEQFSGKRALGRYFQAA